MEHTNGNGHVDVNVNGKVHRNGNGKVAFDTNGSPKLSQHMNGNGKLTTDPVKPFAHINGKTVKMVDSKNGTLPKKLGRTVTPRADGPACILAIGTANPKAEYKQSEYTDWYFNATNSDHETELKDRFRRICEKSGIQKKYLHVNDELLAKHPNLRDFNDLSVDERIAMGVEASPKLGAEAAEKALEEWGRPRSEITHVVYTASCGVHMPGHDFTVSVLLGLRPDVKRCMMYHQGCFAGGSALRIAKDMAENNATARVLVVVSELTVETWRGPAHNNVSHLVGTAIFADGAAAIIVGADPLPAIEKPIFEVQWSGEAFIPDTVSDIQVRLRQGGLYFFLSKQLPKLVTQNSSAIVDEALAQAGSPGYNDIFWIVHPAGRAVLDELDKQYDLQPDKLIATRDTLRDYGNMFGASVFFAMDRMRKRSKEIGASTTGEGAEWGLCMAMGPGVTIEISLLRAVSS